MLETRDLYKVYKPKKGVAVTALNGISLKFPEKGMVFLLGKSGSGKSTLLNMLGGLDKYDGGEIIIKGVSSKQFDQQSFDSYRNTYVGFIFQEYNILEEFSVGANIALALELQGKKASDEEINTILKQVDLDGYGNRKPNELSGGQKQRVAIARALVKNPEIIMADEPTGALDSNTGRQVFDTLKKLSKEKLVIIVSHDREFSELYADRIIELSDGAVISDVEVEDEAEDAYEEALSFDGNTIHMAGGYHLTEEDRAMINAYVDQLAGKKAEISITQNRGKKFVTTNQEKIKMQEKASFQLIKSRLPLKSAFKIGVSGLKHKKIRLVITILLSCIAFALFGLADTFGSYRHVDACTNSLIDSGVDYVSMQKATRVEESDVLYYYDTYNTTITKGEVKELTERTGIPLRGVYAPLSAALSFFDVIGDMENVSQTEYDIYARTFTGFLNVSEEMLKEYDYKLLAGKLPDGTKDEIAISEYVYRTFEKGGYNTQTAEEGGTLEKISKYEDMIGKSIAINNREYIITGIIDTHFDFDRYETLMEKKDNRGTAEQIIEYALSMEFEYASRYSLAGIAFTGEGKVEELIQEEPDISPLRDYYVSYFSEEYYLDSTYAGKLECIKDKNVIWLDGEKAELAEHEIIVSEDAIYSTGYGEEVIDLQNEELLAKLKSQKFTIRAFSAYSGEDLESADDYKIVGIIPLEEQQAYASTIVMSDLEYSRYIKEERGEYTFVVGPMPETEEEIHAMAEYCYREDSDVQYQLQNAVTYELNSIHEVLNVLSKLFLYIGIGFAIFASVMLANFIATSISYKKQEIGILRAIGSRSNDVFRIFFSESFVIAMINFVLASTGVGIVTAVINATIRNRLGVLVTVLNFGIRQVALLFILSIVIAALASFLPVKKIASKRPIDAIRKR